ncbi:hypothetical protein SAMN05421858_2980 [Haladaptatus litoreus]|uniref:Uncharacterized protein n=1 Tax=Haladaptatus litoreus TaxID=553468 RepID=A0A1N7CGA4_9EURY|nr:hypothetical protein SAMN05421858_2980 [Haladaptatus litoreus]
MSVHWSVISETVTVAVVWFSIVFALGGECVECPMVSCGFDGGHVFAEGVAVNMVWARAGHQVLGHVVDGDSVLWWFAGLSWLSLVTSTSPGGSMSKESCSNCARCCAVSVGVQSAVGFVQIVFP